VELTLVIDIIIWANISYRLPIWFSSSLQKKTFIFAFSLSLRTLVSCFSKCLIKKIPRGNSCVINANYFVQKKLLILWNVCQGKKKKLVFVKNFQKYIYFWQVRQCYVTGVEVKKPKVHTESPPFLPHFFHRRANPAGLAFSCPPQLPDWVTPTPKWSFSNVIFWTRPLHFQ
jgi:hypothetical protein